MGPVKNLHWGVHEPPRISCMSAKGIAPDAERAGNWPARDSQAGDPLPGHRDELGRFAEQHDLHLPGPAAECRRRPPECVLAVGRALRPWDGQRFVGRCWKPDKACVQ